MFGPVGDSHHEDGGLGAELASVGASLSSAALVSFDEFDEQVACDTVLALEQIRRFLDAVEGHALADLEARGTTDRAFGLRSAAWLADRAGLPSSVAKLWVATGKKLATQLPEVDEALTSGAIGFEHARVIANATNSRNSTEMAGVSAELCADAGQMMFHKWRRQVEELADLFDQDGGHDPAGDVAKNHARMSRTGDLLGIRAELIGENSLIAENALNAIADELFLKFKRDNEQTSDIEIPDRSTLLALALVEACRRGLALPASSTKPSRPEASIILTPSAAYPMSPIGEDNCGHGAGLAFSPILKHVRQRVPVRDFAGMSVFDDSGNPLDQRAWRTLLCDPDMYTTLVDSLGVPLDMGRLVRFANGAQRRTPGAARWRVYVPGVLGTSGVDRRPSLSALGAPRAYRSGELGFVVSSPPRCGSSSRLENDHRT